MKGGIRKFREGLFGISASRISAESVFPIAIIVSSILLMLTSTYNYLLFHSLVEIFSVVVAFGIFIIVWSSRRYVQNAFFLIIGIGYFFIGSVDLLHALSYSGVGIFVGHTSDLPTQLWIIARYLEAFTFFVALLFLNKKVDHRAESAKSKSYLIFSIYAVLFLVLMLMVFRWNNFPTTYVDGFGLTVFKKVSEYFISAIFLVSIVLLIRKNRMLDPKIANLISLSLVIKIASELAFTEYVGVFGFSNMLGHIFKFISFVLIYKAILEIGVRKPFRFMFRDLKNSETKYRSLFDNMIDGFAFHKMVFDKNGKPSDYIFLEVNDAFEQLTELEKEKIIGKNVTQVIPGIGNDSVDWIGRYGAVVKNGKPLRFENFKQELNRWYSIIAYCPKRGHFATVFKDITEVKEAELELQRLAQQRQLALDAAAMGWWTYDPNTNTSTWDDRYKELFQIEGYQGSNDDNIKRIHPDDLPRVWAKVETALDPNNPEGYSVQYRINLPDGSTKWIEAHGVALFEGSGKHRKAINFVGTVADITKRKQLENDLLTAEKDLNLAQIVANTGSWRIDIETNEITWSDQNHRIFGIPKGRKITYEAFMEKVHPEDQERVDARWKATLQGTPYDLEHRIMVGGKIKWVREKAFLEFDENEKMSGAFGITQDITELKIAQNNLLNTQNILKQRIEEQLVESYQYMGQINRKISLLLEMDEHSRQKKSNKKELVDHIIKIAKNASRANMILLYRYEGNDTFSLIKGLKIKKERLLQLNKVTFQKAEFLKKLILNTTRISSSVKITDPGCFNVGNKLKYFVALPFVYESSCCGFLFLGFEKRTSMEKQELEFLDIFSIHVASTLSRLKIINATDLKKEGSAVDKK